MALRASALPVDPTKVTAINHLTLTTDLTVGTGNVTLTGDVAGSTLTLGAGASNLSGSNTGDESQVTILAKLGATAVTGSNTGDQMLYMIGVNGTTDNYFQIAEWTLTGSYGTFASHISVMTTSKPFLAELYILCALNEAGTAFADPTFRLKDVFGTIGTSYFWLTVDNATLKAKLYFKNTTNYEPHYIQRTDTILNATTIVLSNTDTGSASNPTGTYAKTAIVN